VINTVTCSDCGEPMDIWIESHRVLTCPSCGVIRDNPHYRPAPRKRPFPGPFVILFLLVNLLLIVVALFLMFRALLMRGPG